MPSTPKKEQTLEFKVPSAAEFKVKLTRTYQKYTNFDMERFRERLVTRSPTETVAQIAKEENINPGTAQNWKGYIDRTGNPPFHLRTEFTEEVTECVKETIVAGTKESGDVSFDSVIDQIIAKFGRLSMSNSRLTKEVKSIKSSYEESRVAEESVVAQNDKVHKDMRLKWVNDLEARDANFMKNCVFLSQAELVTDEAPRRSLTKADEGEGPKIRVERTTRRIMGAITAAGPVRFVSKRSAEAPEVTSALKGISGQVSLASNGKKTISDRSGHFMVFLWQVMAILSPDSSYKAGFLIVDSTKLDSSVQSVIQLVDSFNTVHKTSFKAVFIPGGSPQLNPIKDVWTPWVNYFAKSGKKFSLEERIFRATRQISKEECGSAVSKSKEYLESCKAKKSLN